MTRIKIDLTQIDGNNFLNNFFSPFFGEKYYGSEYLSRLIDGIFYKNIDVMDEFLNKLSLLFLESNILISKEVGFEIDSVDVKPTIYNFSNYYYIDMKNVRVNDKFKKNEAVLIFDSVKISEDYKNGTIFLNKNVDFVIDYENQKIYFKQNPFNTFSAFKKVKIKENFEKVDSLNLYFLDASYINKNNDDIISALLLNYISHSNTLSQKLLDIFIKGVKFSNSNFNEKFLISALEDIFDLPYSSGAFKILKPPQLLPLISEFPLPKEVLIRRNGQPYSDNLYFDNTLVPLSISGNYATFNIRGESEDVDDFWMQVRQKEDLTGQYLKDLLTSYYGGLPAAVNPAEIILNHTLRNGWRILYLDAEKLKNTKSITLLGILFKYFWCKTLGLIVVLDKKYDVLSFSGTDKFVGNKIYSNLEFMFVNLKSKILSLTDVIVEQNANVINMINIINNVLTGILVNNLTNNINIESPSPNSGVLLSNLNLSNQILPGVPVIS